MDQIYYPIVPVSRSKEIVLDTDSQDAAFLSEEITVLNNEVQALEEEVLQLETSVHRFTTHLSHHPEISKLLEHAEELQRKLDASIEKPKPIVSEDVKKLFKKIAKNTHPDKTDDADLHNLFLEAKRAYEENDYASLEIIQDGIKSVKKKKWEKLERKLKLLNSIKMELQIRKDAIYNSDTFKLLVAYTAGDKLLPIALYKQHLENTIKDLTFKISLFQEKPS